MNLGWVAVILAIVAIAIGVWLLVRAYTPIPQANVVGLTDLSAKVTSLVASSAVLSDNIVEINEQLGVIDTKTTGFSALAAAPVTPHFPLDLED